jgi:hypothetical protein
VVGKLLRCTHGPGTCVRRVGLLCSYACEAPSADLLATLFFRSFLCGTAGAYNFACTVQLVIRCFVSWKNALAPKLQTCSGCVRVHQRIHRPTARFAAVCGCASVLVAKCRVLGLLWTAFSPYQSLDSRRWYQRSYAPLLRQNRQYRPWRCLLVANFRPILSSVPSAAHESR